MRISDWSSDVCSSDLIALPRATKTRRIGPGPERTARGAGREPPVGFRFVVDFRLAWLPVLRGRVLEDAPEPSLEELILDLLLRRDPGGEDVRVALLRTQGARHTSPRDNRMRVAGA